MATIVNERDKLLQGAASRDEEPTRGRSLILSSDTPVFHVSNMGAVSPPAITITANAINLSGPVNWEVVSGASSITVASDTKSATLVYSSMSAASATVKARIVDRGISYEAVFIVAKVVDGANGSTGLSTGLAYAYKRSATAPADNPGDITFSFASNAIVAPAGDVLANGWSKAIPAGSEPLYVTAASASGNGATDMIAAAEWPAPALFSQNGLNTATVYLYQRASAQPATPAGGLTYNFAAGTLGGTLGSWTRTVPAGSSPLYVTTATALASGASDTIAPGEWATPVIMAQNGAAGASGADGERGTLDLVGTTDSTEWDAGASADATALFLTLNYGSPRNRDRVTLVNANAQFAEKRFYLNGSWMSMAAHIAGNMLVDGTVAATAFEGDTFSGYQFTGSIFRTAASGRRLIMNNGGNNMLQVYDPSEVVCEIGGASGVIWATSGSTLSSTVAGHSTGPLAGVVGWATASGTGVVGSSSGTGPAGSFSNANGIALRIDGPVTSVPYAETANKATTTNNCIPISDNTYNLGTLARRWMGITSATAVVVSSDARGKENIDDCDLGLDFINALRPVRYTLRTGRLAIENRGTGRPPTAEIIEPEVAVTEVPGVRTHYGFLAQEVKQAIGDRNAAMWLLANKDDPDSEQALRYEELIAPAVSSIQQLSVLVRELRIELDQLKEQLSHG